MKKSFALGLLFASLVGVAGPASAAAGTQITVQQLQQMFAGKKAEAKWNVKGPLLWGYYFTDQNPQKLQSLANHLTKAGYKFVGIYQADDKSTYVLHVEKVEHHTVSSLNERNQTFYRLAKQYGVQSYDGMDVGPVE